MSTSPPIPSLVKPSRRLQKPLNFGWRDLFVPHSSSTPKQPTFDQAVYALLTHPEQFGRFWDGEDELGGLQLPHTVSIRALAT